MTTDRLNDKKHDVQPMADAADSLKPISESRRRFGKSGLAVSGVLVTLASRPVLGAEISKSPSGFLSGNLSAPGAPPISLGRSPGYWKTHSKWPIPNRDTCRFSSVFTTKHGSQYKSVTLLDILSHQSFDSQNIGMHLAAAYLNAMAGYTPFLTVSRIQSMFSEWNTTGYFEPTAGVKWDAAQIVNYLKLTQG